MVYNLQFPLGLHSQLKASSVVFESKTEALKEAERLLTEAGMGFTSVPSNGDWMLVDGQGYLLIRVVRHER